MAYQTTRPASFAAIHDFAERQRDYIRALALQRTTARVLDALSDEQLKDAGLTRDGRRF